MEPKDDKREELKHLLQCWYEKTLADLFNAGGNFHLRHLINRIDVIQAFTSIQVALVH